MENSSRISKIDYALRLAETAALRSEDPYRKVGAVALTKEWRVIATSYNGLPTGMEIPKKYWEDRNFRRDYMIHAEQNLAALIKRGEAETVATTTRPCPSCCILLLALGIKRVLYRTGYETDDLDKTLRIAKVYNLTMEQHV
jgi:dCMP deaminase